jgi:hypothetical protein
MTRIGDLETPDYGEGQRPPLRPTTLAPSGVMGLSRRSFLDSSLASIAGLVLASHVRAAMASSASPVGGSAPPSDGLAFLSVEEASALVKSKKVSPVELTRSCLARIEHRAIVPAPGAWESHAVFLESAACDAACDFWDNLGLASTTRRSSESC